MTTKAAYNPQTHEERQEALQRIESLLRPEPAPTRRSDRLPSLPRCVALAAWGWLLLFIWRPSSEDGHDEGRRDEGTTSVVVGGCIADGRYRRALRAGSVGGSVALDLHVAKTWGGEAACNDSPDHDAFFELENAVDEGREPDKEKVEVALAMCARCPVRADCLSTALDGNDFGIWGGTTAEERGRPYRLARKSKGIRQS